MRGLIASLLLSVVTRAALPVPPTKLLALALQKSAAAKVLMAAKVSTHLEVYDGEDAFLGATDTVEAIEALRKDAPPSRKTISTKTTGSPGFTMDLNFHFEDQPGEALEGYDTWAPKGEAQFNGATLDLFEGVANSKGEISKVLLFVDPATALPIKAEYLLPIHSTFGNRSVAVTVLFGPASYGLWVPSSATIDQKGRMLFWKRHLIIQKTYEDWVRQP